MKGIIFNLLEEAVSNEFGEATWDKLLDEAKLSGAYTSLGNYADDEIVALVGAASKALNLPPQDILRWFGQRAIPLLAVRLPDFFQSHTDTRSFLLTLNNTIHPEVHKLYPGADTPMFDFGASDDGGLVIGYSSARKLCALAEGFMLGAATHYHEQADITQPQCMHDGASKCVFHVRFHQ
ncbi:heme NO-binding domain-containing protein [Actimicrobium antarcticum]|uniref:Heme NO-binding domain-containing protein n=1 Tax=Actimicrobium antarcticum TaxID=1051899 RepID=A0ABP7SLD0_9BURK